MGADKPGVIDANAHDTGSRDALARRAIDYGFIGVGISL
jgi:hypothetical protein